MEHKQDLDTRGGSESWRSDSYDCISTMEPFNAVVTCGMLHVVKNDDM